MRVLTVANQKGGVGKTTTAVTLGGLLAAWGFRTLLVDLDPHGSLTSYLKYDPDAIEQSVYTLFQSAFQGIDNDPVPLIRDTSMEGMDLLPASPALATLERQASGRDGMGLVLNRALDRLAHRYQYVLVDCPPMLGMLMVNALAACERLVIPVQTDFLALKGLERMLHTLQMILKARKEPLPYLIVPTLFDRRTRASIHTLRTLRQAYSEHLWGSVIPIDTQFREASRVGMPPPLFSPQSRGVRAYTALLHDLQEGRASTQKTAVAQ